MTDPVTDARDAGSERHPLRDVLLGAWAGLAPLLASIRAAEPSGTPVVSADAELLDVCLGALAVAWRFEGVLLAVRAAAAPVAPPLPPAPAERLLR